MLRLGLVTLMVTVFFSCREEKVETTTYNNTLDSYVIDKNVNYNQVLKKSLELDDKTSAKLRNILASYRKNVKKRPEREEILKKNRDKKMSKLLSTSQIKKRKFVNAIYYNTKPKYPTHPVNVQSKYGLTDGQTLKLIELEDFYEIDKNKVLRKKRIVDFMGAKNAEKYIAGKAIII